MTDIQAALGLSQSKRLSNIIERRNKLLENYNNLLDAYKLPISLLEKDENILSAVHLAVIQLQKGFEHKHFGLFMKFREMKIGVQLHYEPVHLQPFIETRDLKKEIL